MRFRPLHDRVVVKRIEEEQKTKGGIIIPDTAKEKPMQGEVLAVGPGARNEEGELIPMGVAVGDRVLFGKWSGTEVKLDGDELLIMKESDIMGVLEDARRPSPRPPEPRAERQNMRDRTWLPKTSSSRPTPATGCSRASRSSPTPSRSRWAPRAATWCSTRASARPGSPRTA